MTKHRAVFFAKISVAPEVHGTIRTVSTDVFTSSVELVDHINAQYPKNKGYTVFRKYEENNKGE